MFLHEHEYVYSGQAVLQIGDTSRLSIEIIDMAEIDIARIAVGNQATVQFEALRGIEVPGTVAAILQSENGLAAFVVLIEVDSFPDSIRPGMTAHIAITVE